MELLEVTESCIEGIKEQSQKFKMQLSSKEPMAENDWILEYRQIGMSLKEKWNLANLKLNQRVIL